MAKKKIPNKGTKSMKQITFDSNDVGKTIKIRLPFEVSKYLEKLRERK
jgi:cytochrome c556